jgi:hypothetical protein
MSTEALSARDLTNHLVARAALAEHAPERAANAACEIACKQLSRSLGPIGFNGLFTRALVQAEAEHPLLRELRLVRGTASPMPPIADAVAKYGPQPVADALSATLVALFELLARLVGMDVVVRLVERNPPAGMQDAEDGR